MNVIVFVRSSRRESWVDEFPGLRLGSREAKMIRRFFSDDDPFHELFRVIDS